MYIVDCLLLVADSWQVQDTSRNIDAFLHYQIAPVQTDSCAHLASYKIVPRLSRGWSGRGVALNTHPQLAPR